VGDSNSDSGAAHSPVLRALGEALSSALAHSSTVCSLHSCRGAFVAVPLRRGYGMMMPLIRVDQHHDNSPASCDPAETADMVWDANRKMPKYATAWPRVQHPRVLS
jgi:hypothetical protein